MTTNELVNVRYMVDDVQAAIDFYTTHLGFTLSSSASAGVRGRDPRQPAAAARASLASGSLPAYGRRDRTETLARAAGRHGDDRQRHDPGRVAA
jgi:catechol 2,3-dioxygenase-like lactoylglutathione lyase family enzyme